MKIGNGLKVALYDASSSGGVCHYSHQLATSLAQLGSDVILITNQGYELSHLTKNFKTYFLFRPSRTGALLGGLFARSKPTAYGTRAPSDPAAAASPPSNFGWLRRVRLLLVYSKCLGFFLRERPDVIHFQWPVNHTTDYYLIRILTVLGFKTVFTVHDLLPQEGHSRAEKRARGRLYQAVDRIIVHSASHKRELSEAFGVAGERIGVIPHGSNDFFPLSGRRERTAIREELQIGSDRRVVLFFGIIRRYKGLEHLTEAFKRVTARLPQATLLIVGTIYEGDAEASHTYKILLEQLRMNESVRCVSEYVPVEKVSQYFAAADLVVLPYVKTYTSGVLLTAYAAGKPVVVTDTGTLPEVVEHGKSGYVVPSKDVDALANAIAQALENPHRLAEMGSYAKHLAETRYAWGTVAAATVEFYRGALETPAPKEVLQQV